MNTPRRTVRPARAFTLLEVVLASVLGTLVILTCVGVFSAIERSDRRQEQRLAETLEFARAHKTIGHALQQVVMTDARADERQLAEKYKEQARLLDSGQDLPFDSTSRFALRSDTRLEGQLPYTAEEVVRQMRPQVLEVAVRSSPVYGGEIDQSRTRMVSDLRADRRDRADRDRERRADRTGRDRGRSRDERDGASDRRGSGDDAEVDPADMLYDMEDAARAPGVRGVFELRPDGDDPGGYIDAQSRHARRPTGDTSEPGMTLWWRELPIRDPVPPGTPVTPGTEGDDDAADRGASDRNGRDSTGRDDQNGRDGDARAAFDILNEVGDEAVRRVRLVSGLRTCRWETYRQSRRDVTFQATYEQELPSYVTLELESVTGRREKWMFEVGWSSGEEPGAIVMRSGAGPLERLLNGAGGPAGGPAGNDGTGGAGGPGGPGAPGRPGDPGRPGGGPKPGDNKPDTTGSGRNDNDRKQ